MYRAASTLLGLLCACGASPSAPEPVAAPERTSTVAPTPISALAVGALAPDVALPDASGAPWLLGDALADHARVMLVFYRGDW
jgi:hypothetical protein